MTYFDTGYLAKCYLKEEGSEEVRALAARLGHVACSAYGRMELHAALHRKLREQSISSAQHEIILRQLDLDEDQRLWTWIPLTEAVIASVVAIFRVLPASVFLRAGDAIHLVSARDQSLTEIYTGDIRMMAAAAHMGLVARNVIG